MNIESFTKVVTFLLHTKSTKTFFTPSSETITSVKNYNQIRAKKARNLTNIVKNEKFIKSLRTCSKIIQLNCGIEDAKCIISNTVLNSLTGKTLLLHDKDIQLFCVHRRFIPNVNKLYNILHFDDEIFKHFKEWWLNKSTSIDNINTENAEYIIKEFLQYNDSSNVNLLYMKFNNICDF